MLYLIVLALASFFVWECLVRPLIGALCSLLPVPALISAYVKSLSALGVAVALDRWVGAELLTVMAAASIAGTLHLLSRSGEETKIATVSRGRARRGMPMPHP